VSDELVRELQDLQQHAAEARGRGAYADAAAQYARAARLADTTQLRLNLKMRSAFCLWALDQYEEAEKVAADVADEARTEMYFAELADALGLLVDRCMITGQFANATQLLAEAMYVMERVPNETSNYQVVHNMAVTYQRCEFPIPALELFDRALRLADNENDRNFTYSNMSGAYDMAYLYEDDPEVARRHVDNGIYAATAVLDSQADSELLSIVTARAHRAMLLNFRGDHANALADAETAVQLASQHSLTEELAIALVAQSIARWRLHGDDTVLESIDQAARIAREFGIETYMRPVGPITVEILWQAGRYDEARIAMEYQHDVLERALRRERIARWEHVQLGVSHRATEAISEADPLTGLPNRRYLGHWLPDVLDEQIPVCVAVLDLDGFKQVNDQYSYAHGDRVLQELAGILQRICRRGDAVVRLGGDEFVIVLRDTSPGDARAVLERVRQLIAARTWEGLPSSVVLTASVGVAVGSGAIEAPRLLTSASEALQAAKREGRDRIIFR